jgi:hypothetical protein
MEKWDAFGQCHCFRKLGWDLGGRGGGAGLLEVPPVPFFGKGGTRIGLEAERREPVQKPP